MKWCNCFEWEHGIKEIDGALSLSRVHGFPYTGGGFTACPWCGSWLMDV